MELLGTVALVVGLMLPGMTAPKINRIPMESYSACVAKIASVDLTPHNGEQYVYFAACEVTGSKSGPT